MFIGPNDLRASFGHIGNWGHPEVQAALEDAVKRLKKVGKAAGILTPNEEEAKKFIEWGYTFVAVGADLGLLAKNADALAKRFKSVSQTAHDSSTLATVPRANFMFLHAARLQAHYAAQWLARAARAYVPAQADDRHTSLGWDDAFGGLVTHPLPDGSRLGLRIADLTLAFLDVHPHELPLDGRADAEVRTWLGGHVAARNLAAGKLDAPPPYAMPDHALALGARYSLDELGDALARLAAWSANANAALGRRAAAARRARS